ncbi:hypothetical protein ACFWJ4_06260 [Kitasatospora sp. NPDC127067]|uniref:hypothetical protein n=1 Tax=Kitasatospora sp. NPDC127067 TaxID=3347126 RepID=UPI00364EBD54
MPTPRSARWLRSGAGGRSGHGRDGSKRRHRDATWSYAPGTAGTLTIPATGALTVGAHAAWYLHNDGYTPLAGPITITVT